LILPEHLTDQIRVATKQDLETAGVLLADVVHTPMGNTRLLARSLLWVPDDAYLERTDRAMVIASEGYVPALGAAEEDRSVPIWLHTHPGSGSSPRPSKHDRVVDEQLRDLFRLRANCDLYGAVIFSHDAGALRFDGHVDDSRGRSDIDRLWSTGRRLTFVQGPREQTSAPSAEFDRNVRAFGGHMQRVLGELRVAVVGCGGTGSAVAEQLVRLGVRKLSLFDPDELSASNVTRVYGSFPTDVGVPKVDVVAHHLARIAPEAEVAVYRSSITTEDTARQLLDADVVFGCTDDNAGRLVLSRIASYLLTPVIDCGVLLSSDDSGRLAGIDGRVTVLVPGAACLVCRNRIDLARAAAEMMPSDRHERLAREGYAPALPGVEPAVVAYTTIVAATAVGELLERLVHYSPDDAPTEMLLRLHEREVSTNDQEPRERHYCHPGAGKLGRGVTEPFLEQTWAA
jgi:molybdopterin/thiamine biosynthesis adenylyltransferase/proteasome lid subunit RPN8/RPN11